MKSLPEIKARLAAITPGQWKLREPFEDEARVFSVWTGPNDGTIADCYNYTDEQDKANAQFIAHSPTDIAALIAEVERLNAIFNAGHADDCGGIGEYECGCGWLQRQGAHIYIENLTALVNALTAQLAERDAEIKGLREDKALADSVITDALAELEEPTDIWSARAMLVDYFNHHCTQPSPTGAAEQRERACEG
jgi:hypothetical protein